MTDPILSSEILQAPCGLFLAGTSLPRGWGLTPGGGVTPQALTGEGGTDVTCSHVTPRTNCWSTSRLFFRQKWLELDAPKIHSFSIEKAQNYNNNEKNLAYRFGCGAFLEPKIRRLPTVCLGRHIYVCISDGSCACRPHHHKHIYVCIYAICKDQMHVLTLLCRQCVNQPLRGPA